MSTVDAIDVCKRCKGPNFSNFDCHKQTFNDFCLGCGTSLEEFHKSDDNGEVVCNEAGQIIIDATYKEGVGVAYVKEGKVGKYHTLQDTSDETINHWRKRLAEDGIDKERSYLSIFLNGELDYVVGKEPDVVF